MIVEVVEDTYTNALELIPGDIFSFEDPEPWAIDVDGDSHDYTGIYVVTNHTDDTGDGEYVYCVRLEDGAGARFYAEEPVVEISGKLIADSVGIRKAHR